MSLVKRSRTDAIGATEFDAASADVVDVAIQTLHSLVDMSTIDEQLEAFAYSKFTFTLPLTNRNDYQPLGGLPVFRVLDARCRQHSVMSLQAINGLDAGIAEAYKSDPEMARWALRRILQPLGIAAQTSERVDGSKEDPDLGIVKAGTKTLEAYGAMPGAIAVFDVPPLGTADARVGSVADGTDCRRQTLYTRPMNPSITAVTYNRAMAQIIHNPQNWAAAMSGYSTSANVWLNAAASRINASVFKGLMLIFALVEAGKLGGLEELTASPTAVTNEQKAHELVERLAQYLHLINDYGDARALTAATQDKYKIAKVRYARLAFFVPTHDNKVVITDEYGYYFDTVAGGYKSRARTMDLRELQSGTAAADIVNMQVNANTLEVMSFTEAINDEWRWMAGTYFSQSNTRGSNKAHLSLIACS